LVRFPKHRSHDSLIVPGFGMISLIVFDVSYIRLLWWELPFGAAKKNTCFRGTGKRPIALLVLSWGGSLGSLHDAGLGISFNKDRVLGRWLIPAPSIHRKQATYSMFPRRYVSWTELKVK
jgi:hypothetical protein